MTLNLYENALFSSSISINVSTEIANNSSDLVLQTISRNTLVSLIIVAAIN